MLICKVRFRFWVFQFYKCPVGLQKVKRVWCGVVLHIAVHLIFPRATVPSLTVTARHPQTEQESPHLQDLRVSLFSPASGNALEHRHSLSILRIQFWNLSLLLFITKYYMISFTVEGILFKFLFFHSLLLVYKSY